MENSFAYWQALDEASWISELEKRLATLSPSERRASLALELDQKAWREGWRTATGPLARLPYAVKDLYDMEGVPTTASSSFLTELRPLPRQTSEAVETLNTAGGVPVAKSHLNEFAYGLTGENQTFGDCPHPAFSNRLSGGSSSGSAFLVGRGILPLALGTDTGGSVRTPAAYCGVWGYRADPSWLKRGCFPLAPGFDTPGWFTQTAPDLLRVIEALIPARPEESGEHPIPPRGLNLLPAEFEAQVGTALDLLNWVRDEEARAEYEAETEARQHAFAVIQSTEAYHVHRDWLESHRDRYTPTVWNLIDRGRNWTEFDRDRAARSRLECIRFFTTAFEAHDFILLPAASTVAPQKHELDMAFRKEVLRWNVAGSLAELPAITIPVPVPSGLSLGIQVLFPSREKGRYRETLTGFIIE